MTLDEAVDLALQNNRQIQMAELEVKKSNELVAVERTYLYPAFNFSLLESWLLSSLDFTFKKGSLGTTPETGPIPSVTTKISSPAGLYTYISGTAYQPLTELYRIWMGIHVARLGHELAQEELRSQQQSITNDVKRAYFGLLQLQSSLDTTEEAITFYRELDRTMTEYVENKAAYKYESLNVKAELANEEYKALTLHDSLETQMEQLNKLIGRDLMTEFRVSQVPEPKEDEMDLGSAQSLALQQRPELKEAQLKIEQAEYQKRIIKSKYIPDIDIAFNYLSPFNVEIIPDNIATVGLLLRWDIFDWGRKKHEMAASTMVIEKANKALNENQQQILIEVNSLFRKLKETRELLRVCQLRQTAAREKLRVTMDEFKQNAAILKDVLEARTSLSEANNQYQQTLLTLWTARADFEKALGEE